MVFKDNAVMKTTRRQQKTFCMLSSAAAASFRHFFVYSSRRNFFYVSSPDLFLDLPEVILTKLTFASISPQESVGKLLLFFS